MRVRLYQQDFVTLDGSGNGTAKVGPLSAREIHYPQVASVSVSDTTNEATCSVYAGGINYRQFIDGCIDGSSGDSTDHISGSTIHIGEYVWAVWSGGTPGARATLTVTGEKEI